MRREDLMKTFKLVKCCVESLFVVTILKMTRYTSSCLCRDAVSTLFNHNNTRFLKTSET